MRSIPRLKRSMFCVKCGHENKSGSNFCGKCGAKLVPVEVKQPDIPAAEAADIAVEPVETVAEPVAETEAVAVAEPADEVIADEAQPSVQPAADTVVEVKRPSKLRRVLFITVPALVLCAAIVLGMFVWPGIDFFRGWAIKTFGTSEDYYRFVQSNSVQGLTSEVTSAYSLMLDSLNGDEKSAAASTEIKLTPSEELLTLINDEVFYGQMDLDWLQSIALGLEANVVDGKEQATVTLRLSDKDIMSIDTILDLSDYTCWLGIPEINKQYIKMDAAQTADADVEELIKFEAAIRKAAKVMPTAEQLQDIMDRYTEIALKAIDDVEVSQGELSVGGIEQTVTELTVEMDAEMFANMCIDVLEAMKKDEQIEDIISDVAAEMEDSITANDVYNDFIDWLDDAIDQLKDLKDGEGVIEITDYVNDRHEIIGRKFEGDGDKVYYFTVTKGNKFASKVKVNDELVITGSGAVSGDALAAEYAVKVDGIDVADVVIKDYDLKSAKEGYLNGVITVTPTDEFIDELDIDASVASVISLTDMFCEIKLESSEEKAVAEISLMTGKSKLLALTVTGQQTESTAITVPSDAVDMNDEQSASAWLESIDIETLLQNLKSAGVPQEYVDAFEVGFWSALAPDAGDYSNGTGNYEDLPAYAAGDDELLTEIPEDLASGNVLYDVA